MSTLPGSLRHSTDQCVDWEEVYTAMQAAGVPTVPGSDGLVRNPEEAFRVAKEVTPDSSRRCMP